MAEEKEHLLTRPPDHEMGYKNKGSVAVDEELNDLSAAVAFIREQAHCLEELRQTVKEEQEKNLKLVDQLDRVNEDVKQLQDQKAKELESKNDEVSKLRVTMEAQKELQASVIDELRFQIQSLRNKMETSRNMLIENGTPASTRTSAMSGKQPLSELSPKRMMRNNSQDSVCSTGSNPCLLSRVSAAHQVQFVWRINQFTRKLKKIQAGSYEDPSRSAPFSTGPHGYRLSMWAYLNGRGKGEDKCLSLYVRIMAGEYDPVLQWPVKPCYTFHLVSQSTDPNKRLDLVRVRDLSIKHGGIARPEKDDKSIIVGFDDFIVHEDIEKKEFLCDDVIFIRCIVDISH